MFCVMLKVGHRYKVSMKNYKKSDPQKAKNRAFWWPICMVIRSTTK